MSAYFISDLHFGHVNMAIKRGFKTVQEHDTHIIQQWNKVINKGDVVYILGDVTMEKSSSYYMLDFLKGEKKIILGNHDRHQDVPKLLRHVNSVCAAMKYKGCMLTHIPIHPSEIERFSFNIHGHVHEKTLSDKRYINVSCEAIDYVPRTLEYLIEKHR